MENKGRYETLLSKYLAGELSRREEAQLQGWIHQREEHRSELETAKRLWDLMQITGSSQSATVDKEWMKLKDDLGDQEAKVISLLTREMAVPQEAAVKKWYQSQMWRRIAVAAVLVIALGAGLKWLYMDPQHINVSQATVERQPARVDAIKTEENRSDKAKTLMLDDGSTVVLFPNSELTYHSGFSPDKRDIVVKGKAQFAVQDDKNRPFVVYAGDIRTTDIGTIFTVTAFDNEHTITVAVEEGKVLVSPIDKANTTFRNEMMLTAGDELVYDRLNKTLRQTKNQQMTQKAEQPTAKTNERKNNPQIPKGFKNSWFMFNNQPLNEVFRSIEQMYGVKIRYDESAMRNAYFIGRFNSSDSVQTILHHIALLNDLVVTQEENTFTIKQK